MAANVNTYINAGAAAINAATGISQNLADNNARYDKMAVESISSTAKTKSNRIKNKAAVKISKARADTKLEANKIEIDTANKLYNDKKQMRMAGMLAGGAQMLGMAHYYNKKKDEPNAALPLLQQQSEFYQQQINNSQNEINTLNERLKGLKTGKKNSGANTASGTETMPVQTGNMSPQTGTTAWQKLGNTIAFGEGTTGEKGYTTQFTGTQFSGFGDHPRQLRASGGLKSDASGKYQFLSTTWDGAAKALGLTDFSPQSQEAAGRYLTQKRGVDPDKPITNINDFRQVMDKLAPEWASLPTASTGTSYYGQGGKTLDQLWTYYQSQ